MLENFFRPIFLVLIPFKWYQNMSGWGTGTCLTITPIATDFILILCYLSDLTEVKCYRTK